MNNLVCITPKYSISNYNYERLEIDKNWINYFKKLNLEILIINETNLKLIKKLKPRCIVISGGGDIHGVSKKKIDLKRDKFELKVFKLFSKKIPIICVCRGFQLIAEKIYNSGLIKINNHINKNHYIYNSKKRLNVNSFHKYSIKTLPKTFNEIFRHKDYSIELAISNKDKVLLSMFHPERFNRDQLKINKILKSFLK
jgi:gamma-glutamyl-gamma-aminobutyrate hydrolase PuuD